MKIKFCIVHCVLCIFFYLCSVKVKVFENIEDFPQFEAQNVFQTAEWMRLFEGEDDTKVVLFAVYANAQCTMHNAQLDAIGDMDKSQLLLLQPVVIQRFVKWLPWRLGAYAVAWREPWRNLDVFDAEAQQAFILLSKAIEKYCKSRALYIEYRHFSNDNIYHSSLVTSHYKALPWYNIYRKFEAGDNVAKFMNKAKQRQLRQSLAAGVQIEHNPTPEQITEWYQLLKKLYHRIHRPLPSLQLFQRLNKSGIGKLFVVIYQGTIISGSALLFLKQNKSQFSTLNSQLFCEYYRASTPEKYTGIYPSVVATWQELQFVVDYGGGIFDFMGAGPRNKEYGVRKFKLTFGGELTPEYRYRKYLI